MEQLAKQFKGNGFSVFKRKLKRFVQQQYPENNNTVIAA